MDRKKRQNRLRDVLAEPLEERRLLSSTPLAVAPVEKLANDTSEDTEDSQDASETTGETTSEAEASESSSAVVNPIGGDESELAAEEPNADSASEQGTADTKESTDQSDSQTDQEQEQGDLSATGKEDVATSETEQTANSGDSGKTGDSAPENDEPAPTSDDTAGVSDVDSATVATSASDSSAEDQAVENAENTGQNDPESKQAEETKDNTPAAASEPVSEDKDSSSPESVESARATPTEAPDQSENSLDDDDDNGQDDDSDDANDDDDQGDATRSPGDDDDDQAEPTSKPTDIRDKQETPSATSEVSADSSSDPEPQSDADGQSNRDPSPSKADDDQSEEGTNRVVPTGLETALKNVQNNPVTSKASEAIQRNIDRKLDKQTESTKVTSNETSQDKQDLPELGSTPQSDSLPAAADANRLTAAASPQAQIEDASEQLLPGSVLPGLEPPNQASDESPTAASETVESESTNERPNHQTAGTSEAALVSTSAENSLLSEANPTSPVPTELPSLVSANRNGSDANEPIELPAFSSAKPLPKQGDLVSNQIPSMPQEVAPSTGEPSVAPTTSVQDVSIELTEKPDTDSTASDLTSTENVERTTDAERNSAPFMSLESPNSGMSIESPEANPEQDLAASKQTPDLATGMDVTATPTPQPPVSSNSEFSQAQIEQAQKPASPVQDSLDSPPEELIPVETIASAATPQIAESASMADDPAETLTQNTNRNWEPATPQTPEPSLPEANDSAIAASSEENLTAPIMDAAESELQERQSQVNQFASSDNIESFVDAAAESTAAPPNSDSDRPLAPNTFSEEPTHSDEGTTTDTTDIGDDSAIASDHGGDAETQAESYFPPQLESVLKAVGEVLTSLQPDDDNASETPTLQTTEVATLTAATDFRSEDSNMDSDSSLLGSSEESTTNEDVDINMEENTGRDSSTAGSSIDASSYDAGTIPAEQHLSSNYEENTDDQSMPSVSDDFDDPVRIPDSEQTFVSNVASESAQSDGPSPTIEPLTPDRPSVSIEAEPSSTAESTSSRPEYADGAEDNSEDPATPEGATVAEPLELELDQEAPGTLAVRNEDLQRAEELEVAVEEDAVNQVARSTSLTEETTLEATPSPTRTPDVAKTTEDLSELRARQTRPELAADIEKLAPVESSEIAEPGSDELAFDKLTQETIQNFVDIVQQKIARGGSISEIVEQVNELLGAEGFEDGFESSTELQELLSNSTEQRELPDQASERSTSEEVDTKPASTSDQRPVDREAEQDDDCQEEQEEQSESSSARPPNSSKDTPQELASDPELANNPTGAFNLAVEDEPPESPPTKSRNADGEHELTSKSTDNGFDTNLENPRSVSTDLQSNLNVGTDRSDAEDAPHVADLERTTTSNLKIGLVEVEGSATIAPDRNAELSQPEGTPPTQLRGSMPMALGLSYALDFCRRTWKRLRHSFDDNEPHNGTQSDERHS